MLLTRRITSRSLLALWLGLVAAVGCDCGGDPKADGDAAADVDVGETGVCVELGEACESSVECCAGRCAVGGEGTKVCIDEGTCVSNGESCSRAADCCTLSCSGGTCQGDGSLCAPAGDDCGGDSDCCSNQCEGGVCVSIGGACSSYGEVCGTEGYDQGCCSKLCTNFGTAEEPVLRCDRASVCGARGEICAVGSDCCSGVCVDGRCPTQSDVGSLLFAGEPCQKDSDCASYACASPAPGAPKTCQFLGGCRPVGEICSEDWQCCSQHNLADGEPGNYCDEATGRNIGTGCVPHAIEGLSTCSGQTAQTGEKEIGEICLDTEGNPVHDCCGECEQSLTGVWRCAGSDGFAECRADGELCSAADQCCSNICRPVETETGTELQCGQCVAPGGLCTTGADCCELVCTDGVCEDTTEPPPCLPLGASCVESAECCSGICQDGSCFTLIIVPG